MKLAIFLRFEIGHPVHLAFAKLKIKCEKSRCFVGKQPKKYYSNVFRIFCCHCSLPCIREKHIIY